jgi:hypothetical protein
MLLPLQAKPALGVASGVLRMASCFTLDARDERMAAIICRRSLIDPDRFITMIVRIEAYSLQGQVPTSLAAHKCWQLLDVELLSGEPEDLVPAQPITSRTVVSTRSVLLSQHSELRHLIDSSQVL